MEKIFLLCDQSSLTPCLLPGLHPAVLVIPGGGYGCVCTASEGIPAAKRFNELGFHAFILEYRVAPHRFPAPQQDAMRAMRLIRSRAEEWQVIPDQIAACGFSAGGHLACSLGTITEFVPDAAGDEIDKNFSPVPDALFLCYPVIDVSTDWAHIGSGRNLTGENLPPELTKICNLSCHVTEKTPPVYLWHTASDQLVDCRNSINFALKMKDRKRPCELHLFPHGDHGMLLGLETPDVKDWQAEAVSFARTQWAIRDNGFDSVCGDIYTNAGQCAGNAKYGYQKIDESGEMF